MERNIKKVLLLWFRNYQKNGIKSGKQLYKCIACGKQFLDIARLQPYVLWPQYIEGKQTYEQLSGQI